MVEHTGLAAGALGAEGVLVVVEGGEAEALHETTAPGPLLTRGSVTGAGVDIREGPVRLEAGRVVEPGADDHVLVREGEDGAPEQLGHKGTEDGVALAGPANRRQPDDHARGATDAFKGREGIALQATAVTGRGGQDPFLALLGQKADTQGVRAIATEVRHFLNLGIAEHRTILRLDLDRHRLRSLALGRFTGQITKWDAPTGRGDCRSRAYSLPSRRFDPNPGADAPGCLSLSPRPRHPATPATPRPGPPTDSRSSRRGAAGPDGPPGGGRPRHHRDAQTATP